MTFDEFWNAVSKRNEWNQDGSTGNLSVESVRSLVAQAWRHGREEEKKNHQAAANTGSGGGRGSSMFDSIFGSRPGF